MLPRYVERQSSREDYGAAEKKKRPAGEDGPRVYREVGRLGWGGVLGKVGDGSLQ